MNGDVDILKCLVTDKQCMHKVLLRQDTSQPWNARHAISVEPNITWTKIAELARVAHYILTGAWEKELWLMQVNSTHAEYTAQYSIYSMLKYNVLHNFEHIFTGWENVSPIRMSHTLMK